MIPFPHRLIVLSLSLLLLLSGCQSFTVPLPHVVMFNSEGQAVNPAGNAGEHRHSALLSYRPYEEPEYQAHLDRMISEIKQFSGDGPRKLLFFIHGGLNTQVGSLKRLVDPVDSRHSRVEQIKTAGYYPVFINWKSSLVSSYFEHLFRIRQGERWSWYTGIPSSLVILPIDVTRSLVRAPLVWGMQIYNDLHTITNFTNKYEPSLSDRISAELLCLYNLGTDLQSCVDALHFQKPPYCVPFAIEAEPAAFLPDRRSPSTDTFPIEVGEDHRRCREMNTRFLSYVVTFPAKLAIAPLLDTFGTSAWENMERRIHLLFHSEAEMRLSSLTKEALGNTELAHIPSSGGLSILMQRILKEMRDDPSHTWEVVLVGHSMGTIVINELIREYGLHTHSEDQQLNITDIVFLAGAASIKDYEESVFPFLETHPQTHFYNFMLHPIAERGEIQYSFLDLPPRGSLLLWLDHFLSKPQTLRHRTVGRYDNFLRAVPHTPDTIRPQIHIRSFSAGIGESFQNPQNHSEIAERFRFWRKDCWQVDARLQDCVTPE